MAACGLEFSVELGLSGGVGSWLCRPYGGDAFAGNGSMIKVVGGKPNPGPIGQ